jgi:hypothetical protein
LRIHPISLALRFLKGQRTLRGRLLFFQSDREAVELLRKATGQDFGTDAIRWGEWLSRNRWAYHASPDDPRLGTPGHLT